MAADEIDAAEAMRILGVTEVTPMADVTKAYRELSKRHHPDVSGDGNVQAELNRAYDFLVENYGSKALIPSGLREVAELMGRSTAVIEQNAVAQRKALEVQEARRDASELARRVARRVNRPMQIAKYMALLFGGLAATAGWFSGGALEAFQPLGAGPVVAGQMLLVFKMMAVLFGASSAMCQFMVSHQNHLIESLTENLGDEGFCLDMLRELGLGKREFVAQDLLPPGNRDIRSSNRDIRSGGSILFRIARTAIIPAVARLDQSDMVRLTLLKALELGILERPEGSKRRYRVSEEYADQFDFDQDP
ncbi:J domain-containing protein [Mesorhizobium jarvisii]|uniref:J domain-containing protein n=1 Tax=Mesorhizobium jarvisii TaxID=1777867 RepID=UPI001F0A994C|nr:J domain-containing protein [Mesorhizobium jarvisii]MCH4561026.1 J domain-containing protein [Mesorhizobium jarvisii]